MTGANRQGIAADAATASGNGPELMTVYSNFELTTLKPKFLFKSSKFSGRYSFKMSITLSSRNRPFQNV